MDAKQGLAAAAAVVGSALLFTLGAGLGAPAHSKAAHAHGGGGCPESDTGITLPPGFCATIFADNLGNVRHLTVAKDGVVYANTWSGHYYPRSAPRVGGFLVALQDTHHTGHADVITKFGETLADGAHGGTGIALYKGYVYAEVNDKIVRYALNGQTVPSGKPEVVLSGLPTTGDHPMHPIMIDAQGDLFVDLGTATNACQPKNRVAGVPGTMPCPETKIRGGLWKYDANRLGQTFSPAERYASGIRNGEGISLDSAGRLFDTQHGRDQLLQNWPALYPDAARATELPAEELILVRHGGDYGWPYCYYDQFQKKLVLAPEYGGDGGKKIGVCAEKIPPVAAFPGHWAPNDMKIYLGHAFPAAYYDGAFIAFHGSWNRAPAAQDGFNVTFQPLRDGHAAGPYVIFADGFAGPDKAAGKAIYRPMGLAVGPDGALYIADDVKGRIWRVTYHGPANAPIASAPKPVYAASAAAAANAALPVPPGGTAEQVAAGMKLFRGGSCGGCHGVDATGTQVGPNLATSSHLWTDGSLTAITAIISKGVPEPKQYRSAMPPMGGMQLSPGDLNAIAAYVWAVGHKSQ